MVLRRTGNPICRAAFKVPGYPVTPVLAILGCLWIIKDLRSGHPAGVRHLVAVVLVWYFTYGLKHSHLGRDEHVGLTRTTKNPKKGSSPMHEVDQTTEQMVRSVLAYAENRLRMDPVPLDKGTRSPADLHDVLDGVIRDRGRSPDEVLGVYSSVIAPSIISADSPASSASSRPRRPRPACCSTCWCPAPRSRASPGWRPPARSPRRTPCSG